MVHEPGAHQVVVVGFLATGPEQLGIDRCSDDLCTPPIAPVYLIGGERGLGEEMRYALCTATVARPQRGSEEVEGPCCRPRRGPLGPATVGHGPRKAQRAVAVADLWGVVAGL